MGYDSDREPVFCRDKTSEEKIDNTPEESVEMFNPVNPLQIADNPAEDNIIPKSTKRKTRRDYEVKFCGQAQEMSENNIPTNGEVYLHFRKTLEDMKDSGKKFSMNQQPGKKSSPFLLEGAGRTYEVLKNIWSKGPYPVIDRDAIKRKILKIHSQHQGLLKHSFSTGRENKI